MPQTLEQLAPNQQIRVDQTIRRREGAWTTSIEGTILEILDAPTGSWYAHSPNDRYWLRRIRLRKSNGEVTMISLDEDSVVSVLQPQPESDHTAT